MTSAKALDFPERAQADAARAQVWAQVWAQRAAQIQAAEAAHAAASAAHRARVRSQGSMRRSETELVRRFESDEYEEGAA